jgi:acetyltransferase-like isoleucine patch superfamily enzyme
MCEPIIDPAAVVGEGVAFGIGVVVEAGARLADGVTLGNHVTVHAGTSLGADVSVADFSVVGRGPRLAKTSTAAGDALEPLRVGAGTSVGSHTVLMAGSTIGESCVIADGAGVRERCTIGDNVVVGRNVTVENDTTIGSRTKIQSGAYVTAYVTIEEDVFIAPMVVTTNDNFMGRTEKRLAMMRGCTIRRGARVGGGAHILPGIEIGKEAFVATGAIVTRDVAARAVVMGAPARIVREVPEEELLENQ